MINGIYAGTNGQPLINSMSSVSSTLITIVPPIHVAVASVTDRYRSERVRGRLWYRSLAERRNW